MGVLGVGRARPPRARQAQHRDGQGCLHGRRDGRVARTARRGGERPALADRLLVPEPARHRPVRRHRAHAGAALRHRRHPRGRQCADPRRGPVDQARLPAELRRCVGEDARAAALDRDAPEVLLPAPGHGRRRAREGARCAARDEGVREHDRGLPLRPRRHARRSRRHAPEMAQRLRGDDARALPRLQPADRAEASARSTR